MNSIIEIKLSDKSQTNASVTFDGQINVPIEANDTIKITKGRSNIKINSAPRHQFSFHIKRKTRVGI